jgi:hypothetical protein
MAEKQQQGDSAYFKAKIFISVGFFYIFNSQTQVLIDIKWIWRRMTLSSWSSQLPDNHEFRVRIPLGCKVFLGKT